LAPDRIDAHPRDRHRLRPSRIAPSRDRGSKPSRRNAVDWEQQRHVEPPQIGSTSGRFGGSSASRRRRPRIASAGQGVAHISKDGQPATTPGSGSRRGGPPATHGQTATVRCERPRTQRCSSPMKDHVMAGQRAGNGGYSGSDERPAVSDPYLYLWQPRSVRGRSAEAVSPRNLLGKRSREADLSNEQENSRKSLAPCSGAIAGVRRNGLAGSWIRPRVSPDRNDSAAPSPSSASLNIGVRCLDRRGVGLCSGGMPRGEAWTRPRWAWAMVAALCCVSLVCCRWRDSRHGRGLHVGPSGG
jgi:hypothetical protein